MNKTGLSRYLLAILLMAGIFVTAPGGTASANSQKQRAIDLVSEIGVDAIETLSNGELSPEDKHAQFRQLLDNGFDTHRLSRFVLGRYWRIASKAQRTEFVPLFENYITRIYSTQISDYSGEQLEIKLAQILSERETMVKSVITRPKGPPVKLNWRVYENKKNVMRVVDIHVEGVSMALTQRQEFSSIISKHPPSKGVEALLKKLRK